MKKLLLLFAVLLSTVSGWAQTDMVTSINPEKWYQLRCSVSGHGKLADNGSSLEGRAGTASFFQFIAASDGKYYIKSLNTGKYIGGDVASSSSQTKEDRLDEQSTTEWTIAKLNDEADYVHISNGTSSYLNNAGGSGTLQIRYHEAIGTGNGCSLWYLTEYDSPITNLGEIAENGTNQSSWTKYSWHVEENIPNDVTTVESTEYPDDETAIRSVSFTVTAKTGSLVSILNYAGGSNRLEILGADLLDESGNVVSKDYHFGYTGNAKENNTYILKVENDANYTIRYWVTFDNEANTSNGNINIYHSSDDLTDCTLKHLTQIGEINNSKSYFLRTSRGSLFHKSELSTLASTASYQSGVSKADARWAIYKHTDNRYYLYNLSTKKFVGKNSDEGGRFPMTDVSPLKDVLIVTSTKTGYPFVFSTDNYGAINHFTHTTAPGVANWKGNGSSGGLRSLGDDGSAHQIIEASDLTDAEITEIQNKLAEQTVTFTYSLKYGGVQKLTQSCTESVGQPYPDVTVELPYGIVAQKPEGTVMASDGGTTIDINLENNLPFETSADFSSAKWYFLKLNPNGFRYLYYTDSQTHIALDHSNVDIDNMDAYQWAFVGNPFDGFKIYNKLAGDGKILSSSTNMTTTNTTTNESGTTTTTESTGQNVYPILTDESTIADGNNTYWILTQSNNNSKGFYIAQKGFPNNRMNNRNSKLAYWTGGADHGSTFVVEEPVRTEWSYEYDKVFWTSKNIGIYPAGLNNTEACGGSKGNSSSHIGVEGHSVNKAEKMVYADAVNVFTTFKYRAGASHAIMPLGVDLVDQNGNVVASDYHLGFAGGSHYSNTYNFNVPESGTYILRFFVCNKSGDHDLAETHGTITVVGVKEATQEQTNAFCTELKSVINNLYTTKYEPCKGDAYAYYQTSTVEALKSAIDGMPSEEPTVLNAGALVDANDALVFITPQTGKFYRVKGKHSGEYISGTATLGSKFNIEAETEANKDALVFYLTEDSKLMNFRTGTYLKDTDTEGNVGDAGCKVFFNPSESSNGGYFTLKTDASGSKYMYDDGNSSDDDDCLNRNAGYAAAYCEWQIEDVTELPLPIHSSGLSTFSASVDLEIPEGVTVYYAKRNDGETIRMSPLTDVIPANTGVVVQGEGTVSFPITTGATALENNLLKPVVAAQAVTPATGNSVFILGTRDGATGFYPLSTTNKTISGHKSYLEIPATQAARLSIVWDDTETGIHEAEGGEQNVEIYDLTGRRLDKPAKGVNIIGGKLVIK